MKRYRTFSSRETRKFAEAFSKKILRKKRSAGALVIALQGPLGSGKTTFIQGFFRGIGIKKRALSPTFILMRCLEIKNRKFKHLFHIDAYRMENSKELFILGFEEIVQHPDNIVLIEWADKLKKILPRNTIWLKFGHGRKENERMLKISN